KYPEHTKAFVRAVLKASAYVQANPKDSAQLQLDNKQMTGDLEQNALLLSTYNYTPSVGLAKKTVHDSISQLVEMGIMQNVKDENKFVEEHFVSFDDVPDSYIYNSDGTYTETKITKLAQK
ncbi:MAG: ABC transporter substrate-binding protein, partial [Treponema sp.]|nr:ABC transporter substrate-binding protein [Treponema sp.]